MLACDQYHHLFPGLGLQPRPGLFYNRGMAYFRINQLGHAPETILADELMAA